MAGSIEETYGAKAQRVKRAANGIVPIPRDRVSGETVKRVARAFDLSTTEFPLPIVLHAVLMVLGCHDRGRWEKTAWEIPFDFESQQCLIADRKLGLRLHVWFLPELSESAQDAFVSKLILLLARAIAAAETDILYPEIEKAISGGELVLRNLAGSLRSQYSYFREGARLSYAGEGRLAPNNATPGADDRAVSDMIRDWNKSMLAESEGSINAVAMVSSFFSYLEHYTSLALPFSTKDLSKLDLTRFLGDRWSAKFKAVVDVTRDRTSKRLYDQLVAVAEIYRNPMTHGGWDKRGATAGVKLPAIGYLPLLLSGIEGTPSFKVVAVNEVTFSELCSLFDEVEDLLTGPLLGNASLWIKAGLDVYFDDSDRASYLGPADELEKYAEARGELMDRQVNMDW